VVEEVLNDAEEVPSSTIPLNIGASTIRLT